MATLASAAALGSMEAVVVADDVDALADEAVEGRYLGRDWIVVVTVAGGDFVGIMFDGVVVVFTWGDVGVRGLWSLSEGAELITGEFVLGVEVEASFNTDAVVVAVATEGELEVDIKYDGKLE